MKKCKEFLMGFMTTGLLLFLLTGLVIEFCEILFCGILPMKEYALRDIHESMLLGTGTVDVVIAGAKGWVHAAVDSVVVKKRDDGESVTTVKVGFVLYRTVTILAPKEDVRVWEEKLAEWRDKYYRHKLGLQQDLEPKRILPK